MVITNGAYFLARVFHEAYARAEGDLEGMPVAGWKSLSPRDRRAMAGGMQMLLDLKIIQPISMQGVLTLRRHKWESTTRKGEEFEAGKTLKQRIEEYVAVLDDSPFWDTPTGEVVDSLKKILNNEGEQS